MWDIGKLYVKNISFVLRRQILIDSRFSTVICALVYTTYKGLSTQVAVGIDEGLKHDSSIHCDEFINLPKSVLTDYVGKLPSDKLHLVERSLKIALQLNEVNRRAEESD